MARNFTTVCVSGYFDPLHVGHCDYLAKAKALGDYLIVILNTDEQNRTKQFKTPFAERKKIIECLKPVDEVFISLDRDDSVCLSLEKLKPTIFAKGSCPSREEVKKCKELNIQMINNVGNQLHLHDILQEFR